jgi:cytochrome c-type biogenesis protein CcmH/NrfG
LRLFPILLLLAAIAGCAAQAVQKERAATPRENAASQLTLQGIQLLGAGKPDNALRMFEQAVGLDPNNGENYFYIAQAWLAKGKIPQARAFNNLARDYLKDDGGWTDRVDRQSDQIEHRLK